MNFANITMVSKSYLPTTSFQTKNKTFTKSMTAFNKSSDISEISGSKKEFIKPFANF